MSDERALDQDGAGNGRSEVVAADPHAAGARFWMATAVGWIVIAVGLRGILQHRIDTRPGELARFVIGGAFVHDLVLAPLVLLVGLGVARLVGGRLRTPVQVGAVISAIVTLFSYPVVRAFGLDTHNPTSVPHNYTANLAIVLVAVWLFIGVVVIVTGARRRADGQAPATGTPSADH